MEANTGIEGKIGKAKQGIKDAEKVDGSNGYVLKRRKKLIELNSIKQNECEQGKMNGTPGFVKKSP